eukprot:1159355-Pelagomonas_calceolata.AAC.10
MALFTVYESFWLHISCPSTFWLESCNGEREGELAMKTAQLPQILVSCELTNFVGSLSRGSCPMTHNTFKWQSLDGTCLLTHFPPVGMATQVRSVVQAHNNAALRG